MAAGTPVEAPSMGAEAIESEDQQGIVIADSVERMAAAVSQLLRRPATLCGGGASRQRGAGGTALRLGRSRGGDGRRPSGLRSSPEGPSPLPEARRILDPEPTESCGLTAFNLAPNLLARGSRHSRIHDPRPSRLPPVKRWPTFLIRSRKCLAALAPFTRNSKSVSSSRTSLGQPPVGS